MLTYVLLSMLPHFDDDFRQIFFETFVASLDNGENSDFLEKAYQLNSLGGIGSVKNWN